MPWWSSYLISLALKLGAPWLESHVAPQIAQIIEKVLKVIGESDNQSDTLQSLKTHIDSFNGGAVGTSPTTKGL